MTCREFEHRATSLTLWELSRAQDQQILGHAGKCQKCAGWLQQQRTLAATMQTLQAETSGRAAGPDVELALLRAFRQAPSRAMQPEMESGFTPLAIRLSRFFEVGAYVAVAAAIVVVMFLGVRILEDRSRPVPAQAQSAPVSVSPAVQTPAAAAQTTTSSTGLASVSTGRYLRSATRSQVRVHPASQAGAATQTIAAQEPPTDADDGYEALMFCDPLICSTDSQVVRMELPAQAGQSVQTADLVVGYDGVVRAVRIVN